MSKAEELFHKAYSLSPERLMKSHGRLEILGNHTDHNHGYCLVAGSRMGIYAAFSPLEGMVEVVSEGYAPFSFSISDLSAKEGEKGKSIALTRGVLARMKDLGYPIGGFRAALTSNIFPGAGVSSSAAYESLIVGIENVLYDGGKVPPMDMAKIGQFAEREYFGKPCGLLDQIGTSFGDIDFLDLADIDSPRVEKLSFGLDLSLVLVNPGGSHAGLTDLYAQIPADMKQVAHYFGKEYLRDVDPKRFEAEAGSLPLPKRAVDRAKHFFGENQRVLLAKKAILEGDEPLFLEAVRGTRLSCSALLKNTMLEGHYEGSPEECCDYAEKNLYGGACRAMGGGFVGSVLCFVPKKHKDEFMAYMAKRYGASNVIAEGIAPGGPSLIQE